MVERLFLNGVDLDRRRGSVTQAVKLAAFVHADEAETGLPFADVAVARTKITMRLIVGLSLPPTGFVQCSGFLKNFQIFHSTAPTKAALMPIIRSHAWCAN
jgi:hypothetical protein